MRVSVITVDHDGMKMQIIHQSECTTFCRNWEQKRRHSYFMLVTEPLTPGEVCRVYCTEDTPALLSKAGSNSNLSALSLESAPPGPLAAHPRHLQHPQHLRHPQHQQADAQDTSDSSNLSDAADLLEECIQKGIAKVTILATVCGFVHVNVMFHR